MGKKDILDKPYFSDSRRFAEIINKLLYAGEKVVLLENLGPLRRKYPSLTSSGDELERDVLMEDFRRKICYGIEVETESDYSMPERIMVYDACDYEYQIKRLAQEHRNRKDYVDYREAKSRIKKDDHLLPMVTVVLYLGEGHWKGGRRLSQMCHGQEDPGKLSGGSFCDYGFRLIEADYEEPDTYETDLREFFQAMQCRQDKGRLRQLLQTESFQSLSQETEFVIARHLHVKNLLEKMEKEELPMCKAFRELMEEERQAGMEEGLRKGQRKGLRKGQRRERLMTIQRMLNEGYKEDQIRRLTNCTHQEFCAVADRPGSS